MKMNLFSRLFDSQNSRDDRAFDQERLEPAIRSSICTGERVAGFVDKRNGHFTEVTLIRSPKDEQEFKERYKVDSLKVIY